MKLISWNVNGIRACWNKGFPEFFYKEDADIFSIQETKMQVGQQDVSMEGYFCYQNDAVKKGYSGTLVYTKKEPLNVTYGIGIEKHNDEGRVLTLEYDNFFLVNVYVPNSKEMLLRLDYRMEFEDDFRFYLSTLAQKKNVIMCGDLNVAHEEIDLKNPKSNTMNPGFTIQERTKFSTLLNAGFVDTFRFLYPEKINYSWWSYRFDSRNKNIGWRIDYFVVNKDLISKVKDSGIYESVLGSDHAPIYLLLEDLS